MKTRIIYPTIILLLLLIVWGAWPSAAWLKSTWFGFVF